MKNFTLLLQGACYFLHLFTPWLLHEAEVVQAMQRICEIL